MRILSMTLFGLLVLAGCGPNSSPETHWRAGETFDMEDGRYYAVAGPAGSPISPTEIEFREYWISIERRVDNRFQKTLFELKIPIAHVPPSHREFNAIDVASYDGATREITFNLGDMTITRKLPSQPNEGGNGEHHEAEERPQ